jgi:hypothetical protein
VQRLAAHRVPEAKVLLAPFRIGAVLFKDLFRTGVALGRQRLVVGTASTCEDDHRQHEKYRSHQPLSSIVASLRRTDTYNTADNGETASANSARIRRTPAEGLGSATPIANLRIGND